MNVKLFFQDPDFRPVLFRTVREVIQEEVERRVDSEVRRQVGAEVNKQVSDKLKYRLPCQIDEALRNKLPGEIESYVRKHDKVQEIVKNTEQRLQQRANIVLQNVANDENNHRLIFGPFIQSQRQKNEQMMQQTKRNNDELLRQTRRDMEEEVRQLRGTNSLLTFGCVMLSAWCAGLTFIGLHRH